MRRDWDARWQQRAADPWQPDPWLLKSLPLCAAGRALDLACGRGRNSLFLAEQGFQVTALDSSPVGLEQLQQQAEQRRLNIELHQHDLELGLPPNLPHFDLVLDFFYLQRDLFPALRRQTKPGGLVIIRSFSSAGDFPGRPPNPDFVLQRGELLEIFSNWEILRHEEGLEPARRGGALAGIVARKPL